MGENKEKEEEGKGKRLIDSPDDILTVPTINIRYNRNIHKIVGTEMSSIDCQ